MSIKVSDHIFMKTTKPVVVVGKNEQSGKYIVESEGKKFDQIKTIGFKNGLNEKEKTSLFNLMKEIKNEKNPISKISLLDKQLESMGNDQGNSKLKRYIESEKAFIINSFGVTPRTYEIDENEISS